VVIRVIKKMFGGKPAVDFSAAGRNDPCPCGSGKKFKSCHYEKEMSRRREAGYSKLFKNPK
jgi:SEC-C motif-containing protein